jgi:hypothetical protein
VRRARRRGQARAPPLARADDLRYLVDDLSLTSQRDAHAAAAALGDLEVDWTDAHLAGDHKAEARVSAEAVPLRWRLTRVVA